MHLSLMMMVYVFVILYWQRENTHELKRWWHQKLVVWQHSRRSARPVLDAKLHWINKVIKQNHADHLECPALPSLGQLMVAVAEMSVCLLMCHRVTVINPFVTVVSPAMALPVILH